MSNLTEARKKINKLNLFFRERTERLEDYKEEMTLDNGAKVTEIAPGYVETEDFDAIYFEDLSDVELDELYRIMEVIDVDDEKTAKRCSD